MRSAKRFFFLLVMASVVLTFSGAHAIPRDSRSAAGQDDAAEETKIVEGFQSALDLAKANYAGTIDGEKVQGASIEGMLHTLDPHSSYFDRKSWQSFLSEQRSTYSGIGATIGPRNGKVYITSPFDGTPAHKAGILYGDQIIEVNGESTEGLQYQQVSAKLLGPRGTKVTVKVLRAGNPNPLVFNLVRDSVPLPSIANSFMLSPGVGYINLQRGFNTTTSEEITLALRELHEQGMNSLIFDLRGNRGGLVDQAYRVANNFLYTGQVIVSMHGRPSVFQSSELKAKNSNPDGLPMVVLVDRGTASAAEIVAAALQDHDRAELVGESSFGKGLVQSPYTLRDGSGLVLTEGRYYTPSGRLIQRDYSGRSFYDYYLQRGDKEALEKQPRDEKHTDAGRPVYGGDGITPDVEAKLPPHYIELLRTWNDPVFAFTRELVQGLIPALPEFKVDHPADHNHRLKDTDYPVTDKVLDAFKKFLHDHKELNGPDDAQIDKDANFVKLRIRYEVCTAAYGTEPAYQVQLQTDPQMQVAVAQLPKAKGLADEIRRAWSQAAAGRN
ncbi:MAG TPA: S41 family peptidase [Blastocatellia bacterium]